MFLCHLSLVLLSSTFFLVRSRKRGHRGRSGGDSVWIGGSYRSPSTQRCLLTRPCLVKFQIFCEIFTLLLSTVHTDKNEVKISPKNLVFSDWDSEYMNFNTLIRKKSLKIYLPDENCTWLQILAGVLRLTMGDRISHRRLNSTLLMPALLPLEKI